MLLFRELATCWRLLMTSCAFTQSPALNSIACVDRCDLSDSHYNAARSRLERVVLWLATG
jgi:hypothetical protein